MTSVFNNPTRLPPVWLSNYSLSTFQHMPQIALKSRGNREAALLLAHRRELLYSNGESCSFACRPQREGAMSAKRIFQSIAVVGILAGSFVATGSAMAVSGVCNGYMTAQPGDTLSSIAATCGTTVAIIQAANPGLGATVYAGQVLFVATGNSSVTAPTPTATAGGIYIVQPGDTLGNIALRYGVSISDILAANPQIWNPSLIYPGQAITLPAFAALPTYTYYPPAYYPPAYYPSTAYPAPLVSSHFPVLKVTYGHGLIVRTGPGMNYPEIQSPLISAVRKTTWQYIKNSMTMDSSTGFVWVEINLGQTVNGYSTGWIVVRDGLGNYLTDPNIGPKINPNDP